MARPTNDPKTVQLGLSVSPRFLKRIDDWRKLQDSIPPRSEAIRTLAEMAIDQAETAAANLEG